MGHLEVLSGPQAGTRYPLFEHRETLMGRSPTCDVILNFPAVSRRHARFLNERGSFYIHDLGTVNGTFLNSLRIEEPARLRDRDRIDLFNVALMFHAEDLDRTLSGAESTAAIDHPQLPGQEDKTSIGETVVLGPKNKSEFATVPTEVRLSSILKIAQKLGSSLDMNEVLPKVLDILFETFPDAVNGQILVMNADGELIPTAIKQGRGEDRADSTLAPLSSAVLRQVIQTGQVALFDQHDAESVLAESFYTSVTAPIIGPSHQVVGAIHLDCIAPDRRFDRMDLELLTAVTAAAGQAVEYVQTHGRLMAQNRQQQELNTARDIQLRMLPLKRPSLTGYSLHDYYEPCEEVGGDFYSYFQLTGSRVVVTLGDVAGTGFTAALQMAQFLSDLRHAMTKSGSLKRAMRRLNQAACGEEDDSQLTTMLACVLDSRKHTVTIAQAGHPPPLCRRKRTGEVEVLQSDRGGFPLGGKPDQEFHPDTFHLDPGDALLLYTDGVIGAVNPEGRVFGSERVCQAMDRVTSGPARLIGSLVNDIVQFRRGLPQSDDICLVCVIRNERHDGQ